MLTKKNSLSKENINILLFNKITVSFSCFEMKGPQIHFSLSYNNVEELIIQGRNIYFFALVNLRI